MTTPNAPKTSRPSNADLQAMIEQQAAQIAALLAIASRAAESAPAPAPAAAQKAKTAPETIRWVDIAKGDWKPWNKTHKPEHKCGCDRHAIVTGDGTPIIDITAGFRSLASKQDGGQPLPSKYIKSQTLLDLLTPGQLRLAGIVKKNGCLYYVPK
jgi:hypothetical protein